MTGLYPLEPERVYDAQGDFGIGPVSPEERAAGEILVELRAVGDARYPSDIKTATPKTILDAAVW